MVDLDALVPKDHLLRKIEQIMDYDWLYERLDPYYCHDNGRPGTDPVVLIQHLFGIPSLRQTYQRIQDTLSYRWFLGCNLLDTIPPFCHCPHGGMLRHTTTDKNGKRTYRSTPTNCKGCPYKEKCGANEKGQKMLTTHIWQEYLDLVEQIRKTERGKEIYARRKETIERVFAPFYGGTLVFTN